MNKTLDKVLGTSILEAYDQGYTLGGAVDVSKFKGIYSALSERNSTYEQRFARANDMLAAMPALNSDEKIYLHKVMADTLGFMNRQRQRRGNGMVLTAPMEDLETRVAKRQRSWLQRAAAGIGAAAMLFASAAGLGAVNAYAEEKAAKPGCYIERSAGNVEIPCWTADHYKAKGEKVIANGQDKQDDAKQEQATAAPRKTAKGKAGNPPLPTNKPTANPPIEDLEVQIGNSGFTLTEENSIVNVPYESDVYIRPQLKNVKTKIGDQPLRTEILLQVYNPKTNDWEYLLDAKGERHPIIGRINLEDYGIAPGEKVKTQITYEVLKNVFTTSELYLIQGPLPQKAACPACPEPTKAAPAPQAKAPAAKLTPAPKPTPTPAPSPEPIPTPKRELSKEEEAVVQEYAGNVKRLILAQQKLVELESKAKAKYAGYTSVDFTAGFSNLTFEVPRVDPEVNAVVYGARINHNSPKTRLQASGSFGSYSMPEGDVKMNVTGVNVVGKLKAGKLPLYVGAEGGASKVSLSEEYRGIERYVGYPQTSTGFGNGRLGAVVGDNGFAGRMYFAADVFVGTLTIKNQVQGGVMGDFTRESNSMLEYGATGELDIDRGRFRVTAAASRGKNDTSNLKSEAYRGSVEYKQPIKGKLSVLIGGAISKVSTTQDSVVVSKTNDKKVYTGLSW